MRNALLLLAMFALPFSCTPEKKKAVVQNNKLVAIHGVVVRAVTELDAAKKDNTQFVQQLENTIKVVKNQSKEASELKVLSKLTEVKAQLEKSLKELDQGYSEVVDLYKNEKMAEAKARLETVEKAFQANTRALQELQSKVAKEYDIPIAEAPAPKPADMPADKPVDTPAPAPADRPVDAAPAPAPADRPVDAPVDAPVDTPM